MNPKLIQLIIAVIAAVFEAIKKDRSDPAQLPQARSVMSSVDEIIREGDVKGADADKLREVAQQTFIAAAASKPPTDDHIQLATRNIDKLDREGTAGREEARQQKTEELRKRENERAGKGGDGQEAPKPDQPPGGVTFPASTPSSPEQQGDKPAAPAENK